MNIKILSEPKIILQNSMSHHNFFAWPTVTRLKNGKIAVVSSGFRLKHICPFGKAIISFSENEGESYSLPAPVIDTPLDDRDGGILAFGESGVIVTSFNNSKSFQKMIADEDKANEYIYGYINTLTDEDEEKYLGSTFRVSFNNGTSFGPLYRCPVTSPHGPLERENGDIIWVGRTFSHDDSFRHTDKVCAFRIDIKNGSSEFLGAIDDIYIDGEKALSCEPHAIELPGGRLLTHIRVQQNNEKKTFTIFQSISDDGGKTWSKPIQLLEDLGGAPAHIIRHSSGALISAYGYRSMPYGIKVMISLDNGESWEKEHRLYTSDISSDLGYPATVELNDGTLLTVFYASPEKSAPNAIMQVKWKIEE